MMKPQYIRVVLSQNNNLQLNSSLESMHQIPVINSTTHQQSSSCKTLKGVTYSTTDNLPPRIVLAPSSATSNLANEMIAQNIKDSIAFHAGAKLQDEKVVTSGGRVMAITSYGNTYQEAIKKSYQSIRNINFDKMYYRKDIGFDL